MLNVRSHLDDTLLAMAAIEDKHGGTGWLDQQLKALAAIEGLDLSLDPDDHSSEVKDKVNYTMGQALIQIGRRETQPDWADDETWAHMRQSIACIIYGSGGWNRYGVTYDGEVLYSKFHGQQDLELAEAAGFKVW